MSPLYTETLHVLTFDNDVHPYYLEKSVMKLPSGLSQWNHDCLTLDQIQQ